MTDLSACCCMGCLMFSRGMLKAGTTRDQAHAAWLSRAFSEHAAIQRGDAAPEEVRDRRKAMRIVKP